MKRCLKSCLYIGVAIAAAAVPTLGLAQSPLSELRAQQEEERKLASEAAYTSNVCETRISSRIDWNRTRDWPDNRSVAEACDGALGAVEALCRSGKDRVAGKISAFTCTGDGSGPSLSGTTLTFGATPGGNGFNATRSYLESAL